MKYFPFWGSENTSAIVSEGTPISITELAPPRFQRNKKYRKKGIIISSINVSGLVKNSDELKLLVDEENIHILAINETKLDNETSNEIISLGNFDLRRTDRNRHGVGVAIYIRDDMRYLERNDLPNHTL